VFSLIPKENTTVSIGSVLKWRARRHYQESSACQPEMAPYFKTESTDIVAFSFGISENTVFLNVIDSAVYHLVDERYMRQ
jgi:hypothetical protein